jgi:fumarate hydratase, class II
MLQVMARKLLESVRLLAAVARLFADRCVAGLEADEERCRQDAESSPAIVTPLNRYVGYEEAAAIAKHALAHRTTIKEAAVARGHGALDLDEILDVRRMTGGAFSRPA